MLGTLHRFRKIKEPYRMLLIGGLTVAVLIAGKTWPHAESLLWIAFLCVISLCLFFDLRDPVNYTSLEFDSRGFRHEGLGGVSAAKWDEVSDVFYVRLFDPFANQIETEWQFQLHSGVFLTVLVEWPHRKHFSRAIAANLHFVLKEVVLKTPRLRGEGRWHCAAG